jgi:hypothetical protein
MNNQGLPTAPLMNALNDNPTMNTRSNIIAGPNALSYFNHSPGAEMPEIREEGSFPIYGNISALVAEEAYDYSLCSPRVDGVVVPDVGGSPSCSGTFRPDAYTHTNECGANCQNVYPSSLGIQDFGFPEDMPWNEKVTNSHQLHAYENIRGSGPGEGNSSVLGCYEWVPKLSSDSQTNTCYLNPEKIYSPVPNWGNLKQYSNLVHVRYE